MLSDKRIIEEMKKGNIVIEPFDDRQLGTNSYDCTLGSYYYEADEFMHSVYVDNPEDVSLFWLGPKEAQWSPTKRSAYIPVRPGHTILAHTREIVGGKHGILAKMHAKSTTARYGLSVCRCAGVGDVGFINIWTMEIHNGTRSKLWLPVGMKICQFVFEEVGETLKEYKGHYGQGKWNPSDMLPKPISIQLM